MINKSCVCLAIGFWILVGSTATYAGDHRDYYTAGQDPASDRYLQLTEQHHLDKVLGLLREGDYKYAIRQIDWTLDRYSNHPRALLLIETVAALAKVPELPLPYYKVALDDYPQYALTHAQYGRYLGEIGRASEGLAHLKRAVALDAELPAPHVWLAEAYVKTGQPELAVKEMQTAKKLGYQGEWPAEVNALDISSKRK